MTNSLSRLLLIFFLSTNLYALAPVIDLDPQTEVPAENIDQTAEVASSDQDINHQLNDLQKELSVLQQSIDHLTAVLQQNRQSEIDSFAALDSRFWSIQLSGSDKDQPEQSFYDAVKQFNLADHTDAHMPLASPEQIDYDAILAAVAQQHWSDTITQIDHYMTNYPQGSHLTVCQYWLGYANLRSDNPEKGITQLQQIADSLQSPYAADALYEIGLWSWQHQDKPKAAAVWQTLQTRFADSEQAKQAELWQQQAD